MLRRNHEADVARVHHHRLAPEARLVRHVLAVYVQNYADLVENEWAGVPTSPAFATDGRDVVAVHLRRLVEVDGEGRSIEVGEIGHRVRLRSSVTWCITRRTSPDSILKDDHLRDGLRPVEDVRALQGVTSRLSGCPSLTCNLHVSRDGPGMVFPSEGDLTGQTVPKKTS